MTDKTTDAAAPNSADPTLPAGAIDAPIDTSKETVYPELSEAELADARKEGVRQAQVESTKNAYLRGDDSVIDADPASRFDGPKNVMHILDWLSLDPDALKARLDGTDGSNTGLMESQIVGLLEAERSGKNRTEYVRVFCARLGIKSPYEVTAAGTNFMNNVTPVSDL